MMKRGTQKERLVVNVLLFCALFFLPSMFTFFLGFIAAFRYHRFYEFAAYAFFLDVLYHSRLDIVGVGLFGFALAIVVLSDVVYEYLRMHTKDTL